MISENSNSSPNDWYICRPNHNQNETPRGALLTTHPLKWGRTPHTRSSILKELLAKSSQREAHSSRTSGMSQGGQLLEDTRRPRRPRGTQMHYRCRGLIPTTPHGIQPIRAGAWAGCCRASRPSRWSVVSRASLCR